MIYYEKQSLGSTYRYRCPVRGWNFIAKHNLIRRRLSNKAFYDWLSRNKTYRYPYRAYRYLKAPPPQAGFLEALVPYRTKQGNQIVKDLKEGMFLLSTEFLFELAAGTVFASFTAPLHLQYEDNVEKNIFLFLVWIT
jgi:hypothetical protein